MRRRLDCLVGQWLGSFHMPFVKADPIATATRVEDPQSLWCYPAPFHEYCLSRGRLKEIGKLLSQYLSL